MIAIINAMQKEHEQLAALLTDKEVISDGPFQFLRGKKGETEVVLMQSGIGKVNAAVGGVELIRRFRPSALINTGVAGGIDAGLRVADVQVAVRLRWEARMDARRIFAVFEIFIDFILDEVRHGDLPFMDVSFFIENLQGGPALRISVPHKISASGSRS